MSNGYKMTELGELPENWEIKELKEICSKDKNAIVDGPFGSNLKTEHYRQSGVPIISSGFVTTGRFIANEYLFVDHEKFHKERRSAVAPGDIVMAKIGARCGTSAILPYSHQTSILSGNALKISFNKTENSNTFYLYVLHNYYQNGIIDKIKTTGAQPAISLSSLKKLKMVRPPLFEQQKIAEILTTVDEKVDVIDAQITQTQELKKGLMQQLLTKGIGQTQFKNSPLGDIPDSWGVERFGKLAANITTKFSGAEGCCIELEHIEQNTGKILGYDDFNNKASTKNHFKKGDVLFGKLRPYLRKYWFSEFEGCCTTELMVFRAREGVDSKFIFYTVQLESFILNSVSKSFGTKMPRTSWQIISEYQLPVPPLQEQKNIAAILSAVDDRRDVLHEKKSKYMELKKGLMQQLLTGKIRVNHLIETEAFT